MIVYNLLNPFIYVIFLLGIFFIYYERFELLFRKIKRKSLLRQEEEKKLSEKKLYRYIEEMLEIAIPSGKLGAQGFVLLTVSILLISFILMLPSLSLAAVLPSVFFSALPFLILRFRLEKKRNRGSKEAERLVSGLLNHYRLQHKNIFSAIEGFIKENSNDCEITKNLMFRLLIDIRSTNNPIHIRNAVDRFAFGIRTNWSYMLSQCIFVAAYEGIDVSESLEDILEQLKVARVLDEEKKRANSESTRLVKFLVPFAYAASIGMTVFMMDIPLKKVLYNQFADMTGLGILLIIVALFVVNSMLLDMIKNGKFDY